MSQAFTWERREDVLRNIEGNAAEELNRRVVALSSSRRAELAARLAAEAERRGVTIETDGVRVPIRVTFRPRLLDLTTRGYVHHVTWQIRRGLKRLARIRRNDPRAQEVLPLSEVERDLMERYHRSEMARGQNTPERIFCRLDALASFDGPDWRETLKFLEPNVVGIGGMRYAPNAEQAIVDEVIPALLDVDDELAFDRTFDPRWLLIDDLEQHARVLGITEKPVIAFLDDKRLYKYGGEFAHLVPFFRERGLECVYTDPRELELSREKHVVFEGRRVHLIYRFLEIRELAEIEDEGADISAMHAAFEQGIVVPTAGGDLEHKSAFEVLSNPVHRSAFTDAQARVFRDHVLWTRLLFERRTIGPDDKEVDLPEFTRAHRGSLVLKPNRAYGGEGVTIGEELTDAEWSAAVERAMAEPKAWVVQAVSPPDIERFPIIDANGGVDLVPMYAAVGFFPGRRGLGVFGRVSTSRVVNIHAGGGISPFLVNIT